METDWEILPRGDVAPHWSGLYVSMNKVGSIVMSRVTWKRLGSPPAILIMWDRYNGLLALKPARTGDMHAYPVRGYGRAGGKIVRAYRLLTRFGIRPPDTIEFQLPELDRDGNLILDLRTVKISPKAHSQCRGQKPEARTQE
jgi:hypothetical protein